MERIEWIEVSNEVITTTNIESKLVIYNNRIKSITNLNIIVSYFNL